MIKAASRALRDSSYTFPRTAAACLSTPPLQQQKRGLDSRPLVTEAAGVGAAIACAAVCRKSLQETASRRLRSESPDDIPRQLDTLRTGDFHNQIVGALGVPAFMFIAMIVTQVLNTTTVEGHEYIRKYCWGRHERSAEQSLGVLTVSNHRCLWDGLAIGMLTNPLSHWFDRKRFQWTVGDLDIMFATKRLRRLVQL